MPVQVFHENHRDETGAWARLSTFDGFARRPRFAGSSVAGRTFLIAHFRLRELPRRHGHVNQKAAYLFLLGTPLPSSMYYETIPYRALRRLLKASLPQRRPVKLAASALVRTNSTHG